MLVLWMLYAAAFAAIVAGAALALDQLAAIWNVPRRIVWISALVTAVAVPVVLASRPAPGPTWMKLSLAPGQTTSPLRAATANGSVVSTDQIRFHVPEGFSHKWDAPVGRAWTTVSLLLLALFARGMWAVRRRRSEWEAGELDGHRVLVAEDVGPAVVGALRPEIVIPAWTLSLGERERALVLRHEAEHVAARDPLVLALASLAIVLAPWNAALWFIVRRLRLAVEIDCDARVVRAVESPRDYGMLLIAVGARRSAALPLAASLTERQPDLERRILAMTSLRPSRPILASLPFVAVLSFAAVAAAQTPQPAPLAPAPAPSSAPERKVVLVPTPTSDITARAALPEPVAQHRGDTVRLRALMAADVEPIAPARACCEVPVDTIAVWMAKYHPNVVTGGEKADIVVFVVDNDGHYVTSRVKQRSDEASAEADRRAAVEKMAMAEKTGSGDKLTADEKLALQEKKVVLEKLALQLEASKKEMSALPDADKRAREDKLNAVVGVARMKETSALEGLNIPSESIQSVNVLKLPEGRMAPGPIGIITVFLKP